MGWQFDHLQAIEGLSLLVGLAVRHALTQLGVYTAQLKWPNDVWLQDKKLAGILIELVGGHTEACQLVIGVGINVHDQHYPAIDQPWTCLSQHGYSGSRNQVAACLLKSLSDYLQVFIQHGFTPFVEEFQSHHRFHNQPVTLSAPNHSYVGFCRGVDSHGALLLEVQGKLHRIMGGEISLHAGHT